MAKGGALKPVYVVRDEELEINGGQFVLQQGPALKIRGFTLDNYAGRKIQGGSLLPVYVVPEDSAPQQYGGHWRVIAGEPPKMMNLTEIARNVIQGPAVPVYPVDDDGNYDPTFAIPYFDFDLGLIVFVPNMAKRAGQGPFAAAPIVQGMWDGSGVPDVLTFPRGNLIGNQTQIEYANFGPYQGSIVFWITPEWDGNDGIDHTLLYLDVDLQVIKTSGNDLRLVIESGNHDVDISGWIAGTTYCVVIRWDTINTLDGTNYSCISINDVHDYDNTVASIAGEPDLNLHVGSDTLQTEGADSIIEGLTIYRRPLTDGTYGVRPMNGNQYSNDEINAIWNAGAGRDPTLVTGSEDVVFCLPTNSTKEILATGTGEAWSWPWEDNEIDVWGMWDGGLPGTDYAVEFNGTSSLINCGSDVSIDDIPSGAQMTIDAWVRLDADPATAYAMIASKGLQGTRGWSLYYDKATNTFKFQIGTNTAAQSGTYTPDGKWHLVTGFFDDTANSGQVALDGVWGAAQAMANAYVSDAGDDLVIGRESASATYYLEGGIAWVEISDNDRHTAGTDFIPVRVAYVDGNTVEAWLMDEGAGANAAASITSPNNDGTLANGSWSSIWEQDATPVIPQSLEFDGSNTRNVVADAVTIQDLHDAAFTVEAWIRADGWGESSYGMIVTKGQSIGVGWAFQLRSGYGIRGVINCATADGIAQCSNAAFYPDGRWHHVAMTWDDAWGNTFPKLWVDGIEPTYFDTQNRNGLVVSDIGADMTIGNQGGWDRTFNGDIGWVRVSNILRYTNEFAPPARSNPPGIDGNTMVQHNMTDGAGATATDTSGNANHGTITSGAWNNTPDMAVDEPGAAIYGPKGYNLGVDAAGEGMYIEQTVVAETDYVVFPVLSIGESGRARPRIRIYDVSNAADVVIFNGPMLYGIHTGANNQATLQPTTPRWIADALIGATVYNITDGSKAVITDNSETVVTGGLAGGIDNDWDTNDVFVIRMPRGYCERPWQESFCFQTPVGCTLLRVYIENINAEGVMQIHQVQVFPNLLRNGDHESLTGGNPDLIIGWLNDNLDPGDTQASSGGGAIIHSGVEAMQWNVGAFNEGMYYDISETVGNFYAIGLWSYGSGSAGMRFGPQYAARGLLQYSTTEYEINCLHNAQWGHSCGVIRALTTFVYLIMRADVGAAASRYTDDYYCVEMDNVSLTVTPASYANSLEAGGLRIDGRDTCDQPVAHIRANAGAIRCNARPRHETGDAADFGQTMEFIFDCYENANDYIRVWRVNNAVWLEYNAQAAGAVSGNWNSTGLWNEDVDVEIVAQYGVFGARLYVDGALRVNLAGPVVFTGDFTNAVNWGHRQDGAMEFDGVIS